jgi:hypothetical protein
MSQRIVENEQSDIGRGGVIEKSMAFCLIGHLSRIPAAVVIYSINHHI